MSKDGVGVQRRLKMLKKAFVQWTSPVRWAAWLVKLVHRYVHQKTIILFGVLEVACSLLIAFVFNTYRDIDDVGIMFRDWKWFVSFTLIRVISAAIGIFGVTKRKISVTKLYFSLTVFNICMAGLLFTPFLNLACQCRDYRQCVALQTFTGLNITNNFPQPNKVKYKERAVPYSVPPSREKKDVPDMLLNPEEDLDNADVENANGEGEDEGEAGEALLELDLNNHLARTSFIDLSRHGSLQAGRPNGRQRAVDLMTYYNVSYPNIFWHSQSEPHCKRVPTMPTTPAQPPLILGTKTSTAIELAGALAEMAAHAEECSACYISKGDFVKKFPGVYRVFRDQLWMCAIDDDCSIVQFRIVPVWMLPAMVLEAKHGDKWKYARGRLHGGGYDVEVCTLAHQSVPEKLGEVASAKDENLGQAWKGIWKYETWKEAHAELNNIVEKDAALLPDEWIPWEQRDKIMGVTGLGDFYVHFQKDPVRASAGDVLTQRLYNRQDMDMDAGTKLLLEVLERSCICERKTGCQAYYDKRNEPRHWCWVSRLHVQICHRNGYALHKDPKTHKWWTEDICRKSDCKCNDLGMAPSSAEGANHLEGNWLDYGSFCSDWTKGDPNQWCNVGFDTTCNDRWQPEDAYIPAKVHYQRSSFAFYRSYFPCEEDRKQHIVKRAEQTCIVVRACALCMLLLLNFLSLLMTVVIYKFVSNRCGDVFELDSQFDVKFSSDSESDNDWDIDEFVRTFFSHAMEVEHATSQGTEERQADSFEVPETQAGSCEGSDEDCGVDSRMPDR